MEFKPFDVSTKELIWDDPAACLERFGVGPPGPVDVIDSDITALTAVVDKVLRVGGPEPLPGQPGATVELRFGPGREPLVSSSGPLSPPSATGADRPDPVCAERRMPVLLPESLKSRCQTAGRRICTIIGWFDCGRRIPRST